MDFLKTMKNGFNYALEVLLRFESLFREKPMMSAVKTENYDSIVNQSIVETIIERKLSSKRSSHSVSEHVRNLPNGRRASQKQVEMALINGIQLEPG